jgi:ATP-binding cassette subfamily B protein
MKGLTLNQYHQAGSAFINEFKNIIITFVAAKAVINGEITLGMMLAIQYIIGQLNAPINQLVGFIHTTQDAKISLDRLSEIHNRKDEEDVSDKLSAIPEEKALALESVSFRYSAPQAGYALKQIGLSIPYGKVTAIVGASGSGKTTLVKLLLKFYEPTEGVIRIGEVNFANVSSRAWRDRCGAVLQDGFIFSDTIANNIAIGQEHIDYNRMNYAITVANIQQFIQSLPSGYNTKIGNEGHGLSQGQRQRILIARAVYKDPTYIFFDEATNALDANNERIIMDNLNTFFKGRTVIVVAHRLSTVTHADQIIVLDKGTITEIGTHSELTAKRGDYYKLVKNQLELGN